MITVSDTVYLEKAPWGVMRYRKHRVVPMECLYVKDMPNVHTPKGWDDADVLDAKKHFMLGRAKERMNHG